MLFRSRESFFGGQRAFQVQAYPFRLTPTNFARHRNNPNIPFWRMLKEGSDHFEVTRQEPKIDVCEKRYVFNAEAPQMSTPANGIKLGTPWGGFQDVKTQQASLKFNPTAKCPAYEVPADVLAEVKAKQRQDDQQIASRSSRVSLAPIRTGRDGGMHPTFLAKLKPQEVREPDGSVRYMVDENASKKLGSYVNPPLETHPDTTSGTAVASAPAAKQKQETKGVTFATASAESKPAPAPARASNSTGSMSLFASTADSRDEGIFSRMKTSVGRFFGGDDDKPVPSPAAAAKTTPTPKPAPRPQTAAKQPQPAQQPAAPQAQDPAPVAQAAPSPTPARQSAASGASLMNGATPTVPTGSFDSRWGAVR